MDQHEKLKENILSYSAELKYIENDKKLVCF